MVFLSVSKDCAATIQIYVSNNISPFRSQKVLLNHARSTEIIQDDLISKFLIVSAELLLLCKISCLLILWIKAQSSWEAIFEPILVVNKDSITVFIISVMVYNGMEMKSSSNKQIIINSHV